MTELSDRPAVTRMEKAAEAALRERIRRENEYQYVVICLGNFYLHTNGQPQMGVKVYGPFAEWQAQENMKMIQRLEGGTVLMRPLIDLGDTIRRISAD